MTSSTRFPAALALGASLLGITFAAYSTLDYGQHLDRRLHDLHCSVIPGAAPTSSAEACRAAMYSPYSAFMKDALWGGIPISLFALGAFAFFAGFALYLLLAGERASRRALVFQTLVGMTPLAVSLVMLGISIFRIGGICKTCAGIYVSSALLAAAGVLLALAGKRGHARPQGSAVTPLAWLGVLAGASLAPSLVYASAAPDHRPYVGTCPGLTRAATTKDALIHLPTTTPKRKVTLFEDPLCPTCKAFHERLVSEGVFDRLDVELALFPLDSSCNWMLAEPLHPGACVLASAVVCAGAQARPVLEWSYENQELLAAAGKVGAPALTSLIEKRWGSAVSKCTGDKETKAQLNKHLHFATDNAIPVSTPQLFFEKQRLCDEDTDLGLRFTLRQLAPEVLP